MSKHSNSEFENELDGFQKELSAAIQSFYGWVDLRETFYRDKSCLEKVNQAPALWQTILFSLQTTYFIALGRIFDENPRTGHNLKSLLISANKNKGIFEKSSLADRKRSEVGFTNEEAINYVKDREEFTFEDLKKFDEIAKTYRAIYESADNVRNKVYAHKQKIAPDERSELFSKTKLADLESILIFLDQLYKAFWSMLYNGRKIELSTYVEPTKFLIDVDEPTAIGAQKILLKEIEDFFSTKCFSEVQQEKASIG